MRVMIEENIRDLDFVIFLVFMELCLHQEVALICEVGKQLSVSVRIGPFLLAQFYGTNNTLFVDKGTERTAWSGLRTVAIDRGVKPFVVRNR